jgi:hypothetical protein
MLKGTPLSHHSSLREHILALRRRDEIELHIASYTFRRHSVLSLKPELFFLDPPRHAVL